MACINRTPKINKKRLETINFVNSQEELMNLITTSLFINMDFAEGEFSCGFEDLGKEQDLIVKKIEELFNIKVECHEDWFNLDD